MTKLRILAAMGIAALAFAGCRSGEREASGFGDTGQQTGTEEGVGSEPVSPGSEERTAYPQEGAGGTGGTGVMGTDEASPNAPGSSDLGAGGTGGTGGTQINP